MEAKPLLIIQSTKPVSTAKAQKALKKFLQTASASEGSAPSVSTLPDDVSNKLTVLLTELDNIEIENFAPTAPGVVTESAKKKRKKEADTEIVGTAEKKHKKNKKDKDRLSLTPVNMNALEAPKADTVKDSTLAGMKDALKKLKSK
jgi:DNA-binding Xre family transcriptional regulator